MPYFMNSNKAGYLPENDPSEFSTLAELKQGLKELKDDLMWEFGDKSLLNQWESIWKLKASDLIHSLEYSELTGGVNQITIFGVSEKNSFEPSTYVFVWWEDEK